MSTCTNPLPAPPPARRLLIIRLGAVGDVVRTLPAASALRAGFARAHLAWLVEPAAASLLQGQRWIDEVMVFPRGALQQALRGGRLLRAFALCRNFLRELRARRFELVVDFHGILKSGVLSRATGAPLRAGYERPFAKEGARWFANRRARLAPRRQSRFERNEALVRFLGVREAAAPQPLRASAASRARMAAAFAGTAGVVMHPGSSAGAAHKRWTVSGYAAVARGLAGDLAAPLLVAAGAGRAERDFADAVVEAAAGAARRAPATPSLLDLAALFEQARLFVGSDTGPLHLASLVGTPVVQLIGPTDPVENAPFAATPARSVRVQIACNPCRRGCAAAACMSAIEPGAVLRAARELLAAERGG
ncbi:MAG: glycosyltransferase family 9 protein [Deltaproteobacteria bacterium]|nr:glycosyltransferase family 9 protein [Deltaproteobacteria bacterium]